MVDVVLKGYVWVRVWRWAWTCLRLLSLRALEHVSCPRSARRAGGDGKDKGGGG